MKEPSESFFQKVEEIAETSYRLRAMLNCYGGYKELPVRFQGFVQQSVKMLDAHKQNS